MAQIKASQAQLAQLQSQPATWCHDFNVNLKIGDMGSEVSALHTALSKDGFGAYPGKGEVVPRQIPIGA